MKHFHISSCRTPLGNVLILIAGVIGLVSIAACSSDDSASEPNDAPPGQIAGAPAASAFVVPTPGPGEIVINVGADATARYLVREELANVRTPGDAVGETSDVTGIIVFGPDGTVKSESSHITVDLSSLRSNETRRDNFLRRRSLESDRFPMAEFDIRSARGLTWPLPESGEVSFQLVGDMTVHGVTNDQIWDVTAQFNGGSVEGLAETSFTFDKFDMDKPSLFFILSVDDNIRLEVDFNTAVDSAS